MRFSISRVAELVIVLLVCVLPLDVFAVGSPEIMADLWCDSESELDSEEITVANMAAEIHSRVQDGASFVIVCVEHIDEDSTFHRGIFRIEWERRDVAEIIYVPIEQGDEEEKEEGSRGGFVRLFREERPINGTWRLSDNFTVQWRPVSGRLSPVEVLEEVSMKYLQTDTNNVRLEVKAVQ